MKKRTRRALFAAIAVAANVIAFSAVYSFEHSAIDDTLASETNAVSERFDGVMEEYRHSFLLFSLMLTWQIDLDSNPASIESFLKQAHEPLLEAEGDSFDGLYLYYQGKYLYSWDTPRSVYEDSGYVATERPWYQAAVDAQGDVAFTPPYASYANHYLLSTMSQLQPDGETVYAYDVKMEDIQAITTLSNRLPGSQTIIADKSGTIIGSTNDAFLGSNVHSSVQEALQAAANARAEAEVGQLNASEDRQKVESRADSTEAFASFWSGFSNDFANLISKKECGKLVFFDGSAYFGYLHDRGDHSVLALVPFQHMMFATMGSWLVPILFVELLLVYILMRASKIYKTRELRAAYIELGQMQSRLEIALEAAKKDAAVDDLTGMMNARSFKKEIVARLDEMEPGENGVFIMIDGDHFKHINDTYGHDVGDEAIKLCAHMIVGRIRTVDVASRLHGDEFAVFLSGPGDYSVAQNLMNDVNHTISDEANKRGIPVITLSAGAVSAHAGDTYTDLSKKADTALYRAKEQHGAGFDHWRTEDEGELGQATDE